MLSRTQKEELDARIEQAKKDAHEAAIRTERGFYGFTLVQKWVGDKYGHTTGNTQAWQDVTAALEVKCRGLAHGDAENALQQLHERISIQEMTLPAPRGGSL